MEATLSENGRAGRGDGHDIKHQARDLAEKLRSAGGQELGDLMADVQDLLGQVAHVADPEIARLRAKVEGALATAKKALSAGADTVQKTSRDAMAAGDNYVRGQPWQAVGVAAAAGLIVGFLLGKR